MSDKLSDVQQWAEAIRYFRIAPNPFLPDGRTYPSHARANHAVQSARRVHEWQRWLLWSALLRNFPVWDLPAQEAFSLYGWCPDRPAEPAIQAAFTSADWAAWFARIPLWVWQPVRPWWTVRWQCEINHWIHAYDIEQRAAIADQARGRIMGGNVVLSDGERIEFGGSHGVRVLPSVQDHPPGPVPKRHHSAVRHRG